MDSIAHGTQTTQELVDHTILKISLLTTRVVHATGEVLMMTTDRMTMILIFMKIAKMIRLSLTHTEMVALGIIRMQVLAELLMIRTSPLMKLAVLVAVGMEIMTILRMTTMTTIIMMVNQTRMDVLMT
jgi:hypothetical protein